MQLTITIPDAVIPRLQKAFAKGESGGGAFHRQSKMKEATLEDIINEIKGFLKLAVKNKELEVGRQALEKASESKIKELEKESW